MICARCERPIEWEYDDDDSPHGLWYDRERGTESCIPGPNDEDHYHDPEGEPVTEFINPEEVAVGDTEKGEAPSVRPVIDFSRDSRATAREYAAKMPSRVLSEYINGVLQQVADGSPEVDAYLLNYALFAALRSGLTRFGNSPARRAFGREVAHLHHIVQAVIENHADGLPAYQEGERSRKIEDLEQEVEALGHRITERDNDIDDLHKIQDSLRATIETLKEAVADVSAERDGVVAERGVFAQVLTYALGRMDPEEQQRIHGYWDRLNEQD